MFLFRALKQPRNDIIAIAIETGIQNTGMSIFILWFTLDHPLGDITGKYRGNKYVLASQVFQIIFFRRIIGIC